MSRASRLFLVFALFAIASCGSSRALPSLDLPNVAWRVNAAGTVVWSSEHGDQSIETYPSGWRSWWPCALYQGRPQQVYLDEHVMNGRFVPADQMPVYTSECFDPNARCPTCNTK